MEIQSGHSELSVTSISQVSTVEGCLLSGVPLYAYTGQHVGNFIMCAHIIYSDVDECISSSHDCGTGICINTPGSYICVCPPGYVFNIDSRQCVTVGKNYYLAINFVVIIATNMVYRLVISLIPFHLSVATVYIHSLVHALYPLYPWPVRECP